MFYARANEGRVATLGGAPQCCWENNQTFDPSGRFHLPGGLVVAWLLPAEGLTVQGSPLLEGLTFRANPLPARPDPPPRGAGSTAIPPRSQTHSEHPQILSPSIQSTQIHRRSSQIRSTPNQSFSLFSGLRCSATSSSILLAASARTGPAHLDMRQSQCTPGVLLP